MDGGRLGGSLKREGTYVHIQLIHFAVQQKLTLHCKATVPQLKKKNKSPLIVFPHKLQLINIEEMK